MQAKRVFCLSAVAVTFAGLSAALLTFGGDFRLPCFASSWIPLEKAEIEAFEHSQRLHYPYSVIMGGAYSPSELRFHMRKDPVVKSHYSDFDVNHSYLVKLTRDWYQYVSLRRRDPGRLDTISWTAHKMHLGVGEVLLTDGIHFARTRCGNRCSTLPMKQAPPAEQSKLEIPLPPIDLEKLQNVDYQNSPPDQPEGALASEPPGSIA